MQETCRLGQFPFCSEKRLFNLKSLFSAWTEDSGSAVGFRHPVESGRFQEIWRSDPLFRSSLSLLLGLRCGRQFVSKPAFFMSKRQPTTMHRTRRRFFALAFSTYCPPRIECTTAHGTSPLSLQIFTMNAG